MERLVVLLILSSCISRQEIEAVMWPHDKVPSAICAREPQLENIGIYRKVTCTRELVDVGICAPGQATKTEFVSVCQPEIKQYLSIEKSELDAILKKAGVK